MTWNGIIAALSADEPTVKKEAEKLEPRPYPWKLAAWLSLIVFIISPVHAIGTVPLTLIICWAIDLILKTGNIKRETHRSLHQAQMRGVLWLTRLSIGRLVSLNEIELQLALRRVEQARKLFTHRISALSEIQADGELLEKIEERKEFYKLALVELKEIQELLDKKDAHVKRWLEGRRVGASESTKYLGYLKRIKDVDAAEKAHEIGVISRDDVEKARNLLAEDKLASLCCSIGCDLPKANQSSYCVDHTCQNRDCNHPSGAASLGVNDRVGKVVVGNIANIAESLLDAEDIGFNLKLQNSFCGECIEKLSNELNPQGTGQRAAEAT